MSSLSPHGLHESESVNNIADEATSPPHADPIEAPTPATSSNAVTPQLPPLVISGFDLTGNMIKSWADAGYECHIIDTQHPPGKTVEGNIIKWGMSVLDWEEMVYDKTKDDFRPEWADAMKRVVFASFFPPCTDLAVTGARWFERKAAKDPHFQDKALSLVYWADKMGKLFKCPYMIENPVSVISTKWRKPDFTFHPYEFGGYEGGSKDGYPKKTCLWTGGNFVLPPKKAIPKDPKLLDYMWNMPRGPQQANRRSVTPSGFARAVFEFYNPNSS